MSATLSIVAEQAATCTRCTLAATRTQVVFGSGDPAAGLMFIGEGPGAEEDKQGVPFVGRSGQLLDKLLLEETGLRRDQVYVANVVKCRPPGNRDPRPEEAAACRPWLEAQLSEVRPKVIVSLGNHATQALLETNQGITKLRGKTYPFATGVLVPTVHPSYALRSGGAVVAMLRADLVRAKVALADPAEASAPAAPATGAQEAAS